MAVPCIEVALHTIMDNIKKDKVEPDTSGVLDNNRINTIKGDFTTNLGKVLIEARDCKYTWISTAIFI